MTTLLHDPDDDVLVVDLDGIVLSAAGRFSGWPDGSAEHLPGTSLWSAVNTERVNQRRIVLSQVASTAEPVCFVDQLHGRWVRTTVIPVGGGASEIQKVAFLHRDIDAHVCAVEELKRLRLRALTMQEDERRAISQNLHDELGQGVTAVLMQLRALAARTPVSPEVATTLREVTAQMETLAKRMRQLFYRVRPPALHDTDLAQALADYCGTTAQASGLAIDFDAEAELPVLDETRAACLYRLLQEGLNNTIKHAHARAVWVSLGFDEDTISLAVEDDGIGFDTDAVSDGMGLPGMFERLAMLGGGVQIDSRPGKGTRITGTVPRWQEAETS